MTCIPGRSLVVVLGAVLAVAPVAAQPALTPARGAEDRALLAAGEVDEGEMIGGVVASALLGFGIGHSVQDRWDDGGRWFAIGEGLSFGVMAVGATVSIVRCGATESLCDTDHGYRIFLVGAVIYGGLRLWELGDVVFGAAGFNERVRQARARAGSPPALGLAGLFVTRPQGRDDGGIAGVALRF